MRVGQSVYRVPISNATARIKHAIRERINMKHLTATDRGKIETLLQEQYADKEIAKRIGRE